ncbi:hypothetical protein Y032_0015g2610 [Ancylostoma ceylanicum]|nr:hypothetical protein Y032_0015g2610 [Ancylostoma ceylanicum]
MRSVFVILAFCGVATSSCPKTTPIEQSDFNKAVFVSLVDVLSVSGVGNTMVCKVKVELDLKVVSAFSSIEGGSFFLFFFVSNPLFYRYFILLGSAIKNLLFSPGAFPLFPQK